MNINQYYSQYFAAQQAMSYPGFYYHPGHMDPNQNPQHSLMMQQMAAQAQLGGYAGFPPAMMGFPQQMMQHHPNAMNGMPMLQQTNTENEGFSVSEQPENLTDENDNHAKIDNNDENESNGETKSVSDTGNSSNASVSGMSSNNATTNHVVPKRVLHGVVVCDLAMEIMVEQE